jgi:2-hydroxy-4-carboxymuconate semialdehyde hemiacetal dehydrogenase
MTREAVGCAIAGYGAAAEMHAEALAANGAKLIAVIGPNLAAASAFAARHGIAHVSADLEHVLLMPEIEALVIASPSPVHSSQMGSALRARKHVLCEIPVGLSLSEVNQVVSARDRANVVAMACHTQRYSPALIALIGILADRSLMVRQLIALSIMSRRVNVGWTGRRRSWVDNLLWHHGCHVVDTTLLLIGPQLSHVVASFGPPAPATGLPMDLGVMLSNENGSLAVISLSYNSTIAASEYLIITDEESFLIRKGTLQNQAGRIIAGGDSEHGYRASVLAQDLDFLMAIRTGSKPRISVEDVLPTMRVLQRLDDQRPLVAS